MVFAATRVSVHPAVAAVAADGNAAAGAHVHVPSGHETDQGIPLAASDPAPESVSVGAACAAGVPVRSYDVDAIDVDVTLNRYLDHDPQGRMYVLVDDVERVRSEEAQNAAARAGNSEPAVSIGLQGDAIQPLTLRVAQGECLRIRFTNQLKDAPASIHIHGSSLRVARDGSPAIATNPSAMAAPGETVEYEWMVDASEPEGTHYLHSHGDERAQTSHGLFGAVIVEPAGASWADPRTGEDLQSGWDAVVKTDASAFREFALYYHEIGDENYQVLDRGGQFVPQVDPLTSAYRPDGRALNYRSEPFYNRLVLQQQTQGRFDESLAYSSYAFGDPATPMMRSYLGDPVKQRLVHGGSEVFHVHHVHGGAVRWRRQPGAEPPSPIVGLDKHPPLTPTASERTDAQSIGPSETFDLIDECGSGGCQQSAGDFLVHCHVAEHYFAGMWTLWRVYNTLQGGPASTDALPPLPELPGREGMVAAAVTSDRLANTTVDWSGEQLRIGAGADLAAWVERQLPPRGVPRGSDASVLDWTSAGHVYSNEPETTNQWPGYRARAPGERPPILFDPKTGKLAYPFLRPHPGKRPPFAPNHGPAPYLDPTPNGDALPSPGSNGPASLCPDGTTPRAYAINAITLPIALNERNGIVDPAGEIFVLREDEDRVRADNALRVPLAIRANAGEDCVDVLLRSELQDTEENHGLAKVNIHMHFAQFDVQASDGVDAGFNYEQSVRPFAAEGERIAGAVASGASTLGVADAARFQPGIIVGVGMDQDATFETAKIASISGSTLTFDAPLRFAHAGGEVVSTEFVRYRWYPDTQFGTAYFHDHVNALSSWKHGLFGALIAEPPGSTYHDPSSGSAIRSGPIADIHTNAVVSADVTGSFRELALFLQDDNPLTHEGRSSGGSLNLRAEPPGARRGDPSQALSSAVHGDPATPLLRAYTGDPVVVRALVGGTNDVHSVHIDGHWFRIEPYSLTSPPVDTAHLGISERYDLVLPRAGGPQGMPGDYLYYNGRTFKLREGSWGILRVLDEGGDTGAALEKLPGHDRPPPAPTSVCPDNAPVKRFDISAIDVRMPMLSGKGKMFALTSDAGAFADGSKPPQPLVLHANVGDCIEATLTNGTAAGAVSLHADMLAYDPKDSGGVASGFNPPQDVVPGKQRAYRWYASPEVGETVAMLRDWGDVLKNPGVGLYGAIVVGPAGATYTDPETGGDASAVSAWATVVHPPDGAAYRDFTLLFQDEDETIGTHRMPYTTRVSGTVAINYAAAPLADRLAADSDTGSLFTSTPAHGAPPTPLLQAFAGDTVRVHVIAPWSEQNQVFAIEGHRWPQEPGLAGTSVLSAVQVGATEAITLQLEGGAGGPDHLPGDYVYGDHRAPYMQAGLWGLFRVYAPGAKASIRPIDVTRSSRARDVWPPWAQLTIVAGIAGGVAGVAWLAARRPVGIR